MKIKIIKTTVANKQFVRAGEIIEVSEADAKLLIGINKAEAFSDEEAVVEEVADEEVAAEDFVETDADELDQILDTEAAQPVIKTSKRGKK
jgi:hypothetical protein